MARTLRDYFITIILCGIIMVVVIVLMPFFGPQPLSNPIAVVILLTVLIISCCILSMNQVIIAKIKARKGNKTTRTSKDNNSFRKITREIKITKDGNVICPYCHSILDSKANTCSHCGLSF